MQQEHQIAAIWTQIGMVANSRIRMLRLRTFCVLLDECNYRNPIAAIHPDAQHICTPDWNPSDVTVSLLHKHPVLNILYFYKVNVFPFCSKRWSILASGGCDWSWSISASPFKKRRIFWAGVLAGTLSPSVVWDPTVQQLSQPRRWTLQPASAFTSCFLSFRSHCSTASIIIETLTSITRHWSGTSECSGSRPLVPELDRPVLMDGPSQRRRAPPTEEGQVVLGEGAISF